MARKLQLTLKGFDKYLEELQKAGANVNVVAEKVTKDCAAVVENEIKSQYTNGGHASLTSDVRTKITSKANNYHASVGWEMGNYQPDNLTSGYKALFLNYGTPRRSIKTDKRIRANTYDYGWVTLGKNRGAVTPRGYITRAKEAAKPKINKIQKQVFEDLLKELG